MTSCERNKKGNNTNAYSNLLAGNEKRYGIYLGQLLTQIVHQVIINCHSINIK